MMSRFRLKKSWCLGAVMSFATLASQATAEPIAIVLSKPISTLLEAAQGAESVSGIRAERFDLSKGNREGDRLIAGIKDRRFDAVVALGSPAHAFMQRHSLGLPFASTFLSPSETGANTVQDMPDPDQWVDLITQTIPPGGRIVTIDSEGAKQNYLRALKRALAQRGYVLEVKKAARGQGVSTIIAGALEGAQAFFFPRTKELLNRTAAIAVLKAAGRKKIPVLAFSSSLIKAGATASLQLTSHSLGQKTVLQALGRPAVPVEPKIRINFQRAEALGVSISSALRNKASK